MLDKTGVREESGEAKEDAVQKVESQGSQTVYWADLEEYQQKVENKLSPKIKGEFESTPLKSEEDGLARRDFLKLMGASLALTSSGCLRRPVQHIVPYVQTPENILPGEPAFYTSSFQDASEAFGVLVKTIDGRPIKVEGNPNYPINKGGLPARAHAEILSLYDPDRIQEPKRNLLNQERTNKESVKSSWDEIDSVVKEAYQNSKVAVLTPTVQSPSLRRRLERFVSPSSVSWVEWDSVSYESLKFAQEVTYGRSVIPNYRFDRARLVVSVECDFLGTYLSPTEYTKQWSKNRRPGLDMNRLVVFEGAQTLTGLNADHRTPIRSTDSLSVLVALAKALASKGSPLLNTPYMLELYERFENAISYMEILQKDWDQLAEALWRRRGESLVIFGGAESTWSRDAHIVANVLNSALGNDGVTVDYENPILGIGAKSSALEELLDKMENEEVDALIVYGVNPAYNYGDKERLRRAFLNVPSVIYAGNFDDETALLSHLVAPPGVHFENWGDQEARPGLLSIQQPTIRPLYDTRSFVESLAVWQGDAGSDYDHVLSTWKERFYPGSGFATFHDFWVDCLHRGFLDRNPERRNALRTVRGVNFDGLKNIHPVGPSPDRDLELVLGLTTQMGDGRLANVSWLQELPDPVTKLVWDNVISVGPQLAKEKGFKTEDWAKITTADGKSIEGPVLVQPGQHRSVVSITLGFGRTRAGRVGSGVGYDAYSMVGTSTNGLECVYRGVQIEKTGGRYKLVSTQGHHSMEGRPIALDATLDEWKENESAGIYREKIFSIWPEHQYTQRKWAMAIDLSSCTGCSACVVACQSENNIPVVGKDYVAEGREMHWIRIDRYYKGSPDNPEAVFQPILCQHCENAPCEVVCPVLATVHSDEGLNDMVYNRCVGTRYCANNCPYKVRRFNWFNYTRSMSAQQQMAMNPDVTVRTRGVMEKCTFCVQRIRRASTEERKRGERMKDGELKTACEESCPAEAIVFGDLNEPNSRVAKEFDEGRQYTLLEHLNLGSRVRYLTKIRNQTRS